jgi:hypothetical protein
LRDGFFIFSLPFKIHFEKVRLKIKLPAKAG